MVPGLKSLVATFLTKDSWRLVPVFVMSIGTLITHDMMPVTCSNQGWWNRTLHALKNSSKVTALHSLLSVFLQCCYCAMHLSAKRHIATACRPPVCLSVCNIGGSQGPSEQKPIKILEKRERGHMQVFCRTAQFFKVCPTISGTGKAMNFKFCMHIHRIDRNKSP